MEKIETKTRTIENHLHQFYCDKCNAHIADRYEIYDDGYVDEPDSDVLRLTIQQDTYIMRGLYCDKCLSEMIKALIGMGFTKS
jgi:hypothetical protein